MPEPTLITPTQLSRELAANLRVVECSAVIEQIDELQPAEQLALAAVQEAAGPPLLTNGKPTVARVVAWLCHEGVNGNRQGFVKEELEAAAVKIGLPDGPLVMDWNHSAIRRPEGVPRMVGVWHKADFAFDPKAREGVGSWGILVQGVLFSWLFPEVANALLAEQARNGRVDFSMACVASTIERGRDAQGSYELLHNPTFYTNSLLDVPPADKDAHGFLVEGSNDPELEQKLVMKLCSADVFRAHVQDLVLAALAQSQKGEEGMANELKPTVVMTVADADEQGNRMVTATVTLEGASETAQVSVPAMVKESETLQARVADLEAALETATASVGQLNQEVADLTATNETLTARVAEVDAAAALVAATQKFAERKAQLPAAYLAKHDGKEATERQTLETRWAAKSDEDWAEFVAMLAEVTPAPLALASYQARTKLEGVITIPPSTISGMPKISERIHNVLNS